MRDQWDTDILQGLISAPVSYTHLDVYKRQRLIWCTDYAAAIDRLRADGICNLLALTGVKTIAKLRPYWEQTPCWFRILNRKESLSLAESDGFPKERIIFFHEGEDDKKLLDQLHPDAVLTKESGESGYFKEKVEAAQACGIRCV